MTKNQAGWKLVPLEPTPEIIAGAAIASWPAASAEDIELARMAAPLVLMKLDLAPGATVGLVAEMLATMAPAYRAMLAAAPTAPAETLRTELRAPHHFACPQRGYNPLCAGCEAERRATPSSAAPAAQAVEVREAILTGAHAEFNEALPPGSLTSLGHRHVFNALRAAIKFYAGHAAPAAAAAPAEDAVCDLPPPGWYCTRVRGHDGPCAAHPADDHDHSEGGHHD